METLLRSFEQLDRERQHLAEELARLGSWLDETRGLLGGNAGPLEAYKAMEAPEMRRRLFAALASFERTFRMTRAEWIRLLREDAGLSLSAIAELSGLSRQYISRLYAGTAERAYGDEQAS